MNSLKSRVVRVVRGRNLELAEGNHFWFEFEREIRKIQVSRNWLRFRFLQPLCLVDIGVYAYISHAHGSCLMLHVLLDICLVFLGCCFFLREFEFKEWEGKILGN